jgi:hypothetical protein
MTLRHHFARAACVVALACATGAGAAAPAPDAVTPDGGHYYGALADGLMQGVGRIVWDNGARYEGSFERGLFAGKGRLQSASGDVYEGDFAAGMKAGRGRLRYHDGELYVGDFAADVPHGTGEVLHRDGRSYRGSFRDGHYAGKGRYESAQGEVYEGDFVDDAFTGTGTYTRTDGSRLEGRFKEWEADGPATYTDPRGTVYSGTFVKGELKGAARIVGKDGWNYEGGVADWSPSGEGVLHLPNGDVYRGHFEHGLYDGAGTLTFARPKQDGRTQQAGTWKLGAFAGSAGAGSSRDEVRARAALVERALYAQRDLLDRAIARIPARDPARINLFLLAVAGDGTQEVFRREAEFVTAQFERDFRIGGRSLALINSRNTVGTAPMATVTSIRESLAALAARMDPAQDILFLFLTSHGSKDHELALDIAGMDLPNLAAAELGTLLRASGIGWKVVVVSACYSGGFIDALRDDHTLVITASRRDRTSFGCSDENEFTDFGRAYFHEALPRSTSFEDAFRQASVLVDAWEKKDGRAQPGQQSEPQMDDPGPIAAHLRAWWRQAREQGR